VGAKALGREIFVEHWEETTRRPRIWCEFNRQNIPIKYHRAPPPSKPPISAKRIFCSANSKPPHFPICRFTIYDSRQHLKASWWRQRQAIRVLAEQIG
jgi:hypothetical protein